MGFDEHIRVNIHVKTRTIVNNQVFICLWWFFLIVMVSMHQISLKSSTAVFWKTLYMWSQNQLPVPALISLPPYTAHNELHTSETGNNQFNHGHILSTYTRRNKGTKLSLGWYLFKRYTFVPIRFKYVHFKY